MSRHERRAAGAHGLSMFLFVREMDGKPFFYPIEVPADQLQANIDCNPGTLRVEDIHGNVLWSAPRDQAQRGEERA